jgi:threonine/homoserine/homoserine lactone efflux protein
MAQTTTMSFVPDQAASFVTKDAASAPRPGLSAATGIMTGLAISMGFWAALGYAVHFVTG